MRWVLQAACVCERLCDITAHVLLYA